MLPQRNRHCCARMVIPWTNGSTFIDFLIYIVQILCSSWPELKTLYWLRILALDLKRTWLCITLLWYCFHKEVMMSMINCQLILLEVCQPCWESMAILKTATTLPVALLLRSTMSVLPGSLTKWNMFLLDLNFLWDCSSGLYFSSVAKCIILNLQAYVRQKQCFIGISLRYTSFGFSLNYCKSLKFETPYEW